MIRTTIARWFAAVRDAWRGREEELARQRKLAGQRSGGRGKKKLADKLSPSLEAGDSRDSIAAAIAPPQAVELPEARCLPPEPGSYQWVSSHAFFGTKTGLLCPDCGLCWPERCVHEQA